MSEDLRVLLAVGTQLANDGRWWQVSELDGPHVLLAGEGSRTAKCSLRLLSASIDLPPTSD